ncbi:hypothetical protein [Rhizobium sp. C4]|uniref:hypothetical protein n=1 Tax=Rhizobium sp. C4 TaxID=1349800 RepID=UPI001E324E6B|nr:hypothetical protein [Rhizobium sp. C4]MCD2175561.1 hypothetical protein [Rhizobium sp. C4]
MTRFFCAIALLSLALSAPAEANSRALSTEEVAAYMLPDGSLPSLCVTIPDGSGQGKIVKLGADSLGLHHHHVILPVPAEAAGARLVIVSGTLLPAGPDALHHRLYPPGAGPRAPPASA